MSAIVAAVAQRNVTQILLQGLQRLEYSGYDSAGIAVISSRGEQIQRVRRAGKVADLIRALGASPPSGTTGIAHTRWATHGGPSEENAHPQMSGERVGLVHNGVIQNHGELREELERGGYSFLSDTDTEAVVHLIDREVQACGDFLAGVQRAVARLTGAFALCVMHRDYPDRLIAVRMGSPLIIGVGFGENFIASDVLALRPVTDRFIYLDEGELAELTCHEIRIHGTRLDSVESRMIDHETSHDAIDKAGYRHYMLKEIFEQPQAITETLTGRISSMQVLESAFGPGASDIFARTRAVQIVACGSSYYAGLVARYWIEQLAGIPCRVEMGSEIRYRTPAVLSGTLFVTLSQSGETADTLAALAAAKNGNYLARLCICNAANSSLVQGSDLTLLMRAGPEICVASTKAFTTQLADLLLLAIALGARNGMSQARQGELVAELRRLPDQLRATLKLNDAIQTLAEDFVAMENVIFLGRGVHFPVALEGALKLKEISYIHAEGFPAGELKHGPLAMVDEGMPVVAVAPGDELLAKLTSNLQEVRARGGKLYVFADVDARFEGEDECVVIRVPGGEGTTAPIIYTLPLQLLAYHIAVLKGTDVDQPRNLAKSVTVE